MDADSTNRGRALDSAQQQLRGRTPTPPPTIGVFTTSTSSTTSTTSSASSGGGIASHGSGVRGLKHQLIDAIVGGDYGSSEHTSTTTTRSLDNETMDDTKSRLLDIVYHVNEPVCLENQHKDNSNSQAKPTGGSAPLRLQGVNCSKNPNCLVALAEPLVFPNETDEAVAILISKRNTSTTPPAPSAAATPTTTASTTTTSSTTTSSAAAKSTASATAAASRPIGRDDLRIILRDTPPPSTAPTASSQVRPVIPSVGLPLTHPFIGLQNLGATCYMNSVLQCIFGDVYLRDLLYHLNPALDAPVVSKKKEEEKTSPRREDPVIVALRRRICSELQSLLLNMTYSVHRTHSPVSFTTTLQIQTSIQQDPHEFYSLLLNRIEEQFALSHRHDLLPIFSSLVTGEIAYQTQCGSCKSIINSADPFFEIKLNCKDHPSIDECLVDYFKDEPILDFQPCRCPNVKITRSARISRLPGVLKLHLIRFSFNPVAGREEKIMTRIAFDTRLNLRNFVANGTVDPKDKSYPDSYDLFAIICHIGVSVHGGHYIAYVLHPETNSWWKCDDTRITPCTVFPPPINETTETPYMFFYRNRSYPDLHQTAPCPTVVSLREELIASNLLLEKHYNDAIYQERMDLESARSYIGLYYTLHNRIVPTSPRCNWIEVGWLKSWLAGGATSMPPIDNKPLLCEHDNLKLGGGAITLMKRIEPEAWELFCSTYTGGPALTDDNKCRQCLEAWILKKVTARRSKKLRLEMIKRLEDTQSTGPFFVSTKFINDFKAMTRSSKKLPVASMTADIICQHRRLQPAGQFKAVSQEIWDYLVNQCDGNIQPDQILFGDVNVCGDCLRERTRLMEEAQREQQTLRNERVEFRSLFVAASYDLKEKTTYCVVPTTWYNTWDKYTELTSFERPGPIDNREFICQHGRLGIDLLRNIFPGVSADGVTSVQDSPFRLIPEKWFTLLGERYHIHEGTKISLQVISNRNSSNFSPDRLEFVLDPISCKECVPVPKPVDLPITVFYDEFIFIKKEGTSSQQTGEKLKVSSTTTVDQLRLMILQYMEVEPIRQRLTMIEDVTRNVVELRRGTLGEHRVRKDSVIFVEQLKEDNPDAIQDDLALAIAASTAMAESDKKNSNANNTRRVAFEGSGLSNAPPPKQAAAPRPKTPTTSKECLVCTFINPATAKKCEVCDASL
ncbi:ubiquitin carboxyl-terminal hydrolase 48 [Pelomyxa schiedti]|nr:ubiquitin carboxyl-terminal hydrolase 48 [Pelomyxa schiedti]